MIKVRLTQLPCNQYEDCFACLQDHVQDKDLLDPVFDLCHRRYLDLMERSAYEEIAMKVYQAFYQMILNEKEYDFFDLVYASDCFAKIYSFTIIKKTYCLEKYMDVQIKEMLKRASVRSHSAWFLVSMYKGYRHLPGPNCWQRSRVQFSEKFQKEGHR